MKKYKITDKKGNIKELEYVFDDNGILNKFVFQQDRIFFTCKKCNKETSKSIIYFINNEMKETCSSCSRKQTNLKKYGGVSPTQNKEVLKKREENNLKKYGVKNPSQLKEVKEKAKETNLERYGVEWHTQNEEVKKKIYETTFNNYGVSTSLKSDKIKGKIRQTNLEKYGVEYPLQNKEIQKKSEATKLEKYGNKNNIDQIIKVYKNNNFHSFKFQFQYDIRPLFDIEDYKNSHWSNKYLFECLFCREVFLSNVYSGKKVKCPKCFPKERSFGEQELGDFISQYIEIIRNDRKLIYPKEIDILIPSLNLAIEYNGEYWHQDIEKELEKKLLVEEAGYDLIVIWESDWQSNKEEIKKDLLQVISPS